jgi:hypothetical protein
MLMIVSLDTVPDPPAVNPHTIEVKAPFVAECLEGFFPRTLNPAGSRVSGDHASRFIAFARDYEPNRPSDWMALTSQASDPSPPVL